MTGTVTQDLAAFAADLAKVIERHQGTAPGLRLLLTAQTLNLASDEVLIQQVATDGRGLTLRPCRLADLRLSDVVHHPIDPTDTALRTYAANLVAHRYHPITYDDGTRGHLMTPD